MKTRFLLIFSIFLLTSCSGFFNAYQGKHKDNPKDFIEKRDPRDNNYIASGGLNKKAVIIEPAGERGISAKHRKTIIQQKDGFSQKMLNISKYGES